MRKRHVNFICIDRFGYMFYQHRGRTELARCQDQWCVFFEDLVVLRSDEGTAEMDQPCLGLIRSLSRKYSYKGAFKANREQNKIQGLPK